MDGGAAAASTLLRPGAIERRPYQEALLAAAARANTLIVAPAALGKTVVAVMLAALELARRPGARVVLMAPTRPLVAQHAKSFRALTTLAAAEVAELSGDTDPAERARLWGLCRVVCATPQAVQNDILAGRVPLGSVALMVFDECHRAIGDHPYVFISERYRRSCASPRILGLTASPGSDRERIDEVCSNLAIAGIEIRTERDGDVAPYVMPVLVEWRRLALPEGFVRVKGYLEAALGHRLGWLAKRSLLASDDARDVRRRDLLALRAHARSRLGEGPELSPALSAVASSLKLLHAIELLESQGILPLEHYLGRLEEEAATTKSVRLLLEEPEMRNAIVIARHLAGGGESHPKLAELVRILGGELAPGSRAIVFTQYRDTAAVVARALAAAGLRAERFVGHAGGEGLSPQHQLDALERFRAGLFDVLVATSVAEEGLDVPEVDLVVLYEPVPSAVRTVQRRGRTGRHRSGRVVGLIATGTRDEASYRASLFRERRAGEELVSARAAGPPLPPAPATGPTEARDGGRPRAVIYIDTRETSATLVRALARDPGVEVRSRSLVVADFLVSDRVAVERKRVDDFLQSLVDGRLLSQARRLAEAYPVPLMVLEGGDLQGRRNIHPNAVRGAIASLAVDFGIGIVPTRDEEDTAGFLLALAKRELSDRPRRFEVKGKRRAATLAERQELVLCSIAHVNRTLAARLLARFGSVSAVLSATPPQLFEVRGIGPVLASAIARVGGARYEPEGPSPR